MHVYDGVALMPINKNLLPSPFDNILASIRLLQQEPILPASVKHPLESEMSLFHCPYPLYL